MSTEENEIHGRERNRLPRGTGGRIIDVQKTGRILERTHIETYNGRGSWWSSVIVGEKMGGNSSCDGNKGGKYYAQFMSLQMDSSYDMGCVVLPAATSSGEKENLNKGIGCMNGGFCFYVSTEEANKNGVGFWMSTNLPRSKGKTGPVIVGVLLDTIDNKIQFFLNGIGSKIFDINPGEYSFAVSLINQ